MVSYSDLLFARPSFLGGMSRVLDLGSTLNTYNYSPSEQAADTKALSSDWVATGADIEQAFLNYEQS